MTTHNREPVRWLDEPGELPADVLDELRSYRMHEPSPAQLTEVRAALVTRGVPRQSAPTASHTTVEVTSGVSLQLKLLLALWLGAAVLAGYRSFAAEPVRPARLEAPAPTPVVPEATPSEPEPVLQAPPSTPATTPAPRPRAARARKTPAVTELVVRDPAAELPLLSGARRALSSAPARTLELTTEHAVKFPHGVFEQERELLILEALLRNGDREAARKQVMSFQARFPQSVHLERVRVLSESL